MSESETAFNDPVEDLRGRSVDVSRTFLYLRNLSSYLHYNLQEISKGKIMGI